MADSRSPFRFFFQTILPAPPSSVCFCTCRFFYRSWLQLIKTSVFKEIKFSSVTTPVLLLAIIKAQSFLNHLPPLAVLESFVCNQQKDGSLTLFKNMQVLLQFYFTYLLFVTVNIQNIFIVRFKKMNANEMQHTFKLASF